MPILVHLEGLYAQYPGFSVSHSYSAGANGIGGEVDVVPVLAEEALLTDVLQGGLSGAVVKSFRGNFWGKSKFDG